MRTLAPLFADACDEAADLSFAVGVEHLVLAIAKAGALGRIDADAVRERILDDQRSALATSGGSRPRRSGCSSWRHDAGGS